MTVMHDNEKRTSPANDNGPQPRWSTNKKLDAVLPAAANRSISPRVSSKLTGWRPGVTGSSNTVRQGLKSARADRGDATERRLDRADRKAVVHP